MEKQLLEELNRTREIMGLDILIEQEKSEPKESELDAKGLKIKNKIDSILNEIVSVFKEIDPSEREEFKKEVIEALKGNRFKVEKKDKEGFINKLLEEFKKIEALPITESMLFERRRPGWKQWLRNFSGKTINLLTLNMISFRRYWKDYTLFPGRGLLIRHKRKGKSGEMSSLEDITTKIPENEWEEYFEKWNTKFKKKIVSGEDMWDASWEKYEGGSDGEYPYRPVMIAAIEKWRSFKRYGRRKVEITVSDKPDVKKIPIDVEPKFEAHEYQFPKAGQPSADFFEDNEFAPTQAFKDNLQNEIIGPLQEAAAELNPPEGTPAFWLRTLGISTSCSARNNGESSDGVTRTWMQLADARAQAGLKYIKEQLGTLNPPMAIGSNGGGEETEIVINARGENFGKMAADNERKLDGTSGPVWKEDGESTNVADYEKYKYFNVAFDIILNTTTMSEDEDEPKFDFVYTDKLAISYAFPPRRAIRFNPRFKLPSIKWAFPFFSWFAPLFKKKPSTNDCPVFIKGRRR